MSLKILTTVYGEKHLGIWKEGCLRSLAFKKNKAEIYRQHATWNIFTDEKHFDFVKKMSDAYFPELDIEVRSMVHLRNFSDPLLSAIVWQIAECLRTNSKCLLAPPDTIFGDGTIPSLLKIGRDKHSCVAVPHPRVLPSILSEMEGSIPNAELVHFAFNHLHRSWSEAKVGHELQSSHVGGVSWDEIDKGTYVITHRLPTVYLSDFKEEDLKFFKQASSFGHYDHIWPQTLIAEERQRLVGSSDGAFIVEITEREKNVPPYRYDADQSKFWQGNAHNKINRGFQSIFRAKEMPSTDGSQEAIAP